LVPTFIGMSAAPPLRPSAVSLRRERLYLRVRTRFLVSVLAGLAWASFSLWLSLPWIAELGRALTLPVAVLVVFGIAIVPGYLTFQLAASLLLDHPPPLRLEGPFPAVSLLISVCDEEQSIEEALTHALRQEYPGGLQLIVADDGSSDSTADVVRARAARDRRVQLLELPRRGRASALNAALAAATAPLVAAVDPDALLMPFALRRAVGRLQAAPASTVAVAGAVLVRNPRSKALARLVDWDRVAPGGWRLHDADALRAAGGWPAADVAATAFEPTALALADSPTLFRSFRASRSLVPAYLDGACTLAFVPGVLLALTGSFALLGPLTLALLPLSALVAGIMFARQRRAFDEVGLRVRRNVLGFAAYIALYPVVLAPISFAGYVKELAEARRAW
jgi:biofilm PGA synthesis N-glycosyltransferase PgaC